RSSLLALYDEFLENVIAGIKTAKTKDYQYLPSREPQLLEFTAEQTIVLDAREYTPQGESSVAIRLQKLYESGARKFIIAHSRGHRFIGNGLGAGTSDVKIDVYGSPGDYLGSGLDGVELYVHNNGQDQLAQIMKEGKLVIYGDVGQTFMYGAKGGEAYVMGNAAGRPLINAVGSPRVVINGTCLDYLAESFMAGDPLDGGGFVVLNGLAFNEANAIVDLDSPYPGSNLFSLASGGAIYVRDPHRKLTQDQLNGGRFVPMKDADWQLIEPYLQENARLFGIPVERLLTVNEEILAPENIYRKISPVKVRALQAEEAWVVQE
ncbi:MAG: hypothetical protein N2D54_11820, partial [Chloroflexota bacterium]